MNVNNILNISERKWPRFGESDGRRSHMAYEICVALATGEIVTFLIKRAPKDQRPANNRSIINVPDPVPVPIIWQQI